MFRTIIQLKQEHYEMIDKIISEVQKETKKRKSLAWVIRTSLEHYYKSKKYDNAEKSRVGFGAIFRSKK